MPQNSRPMPVPRWEWPTIGIALILYGGFGLLTWHWHDLPIWLAAPLCAVLLAWHGSLQHETIHGHPTPSARLNTLIGMPPLALWLPYALYRETHLDHHRKSDRDLTEPGTDPESHYLRRGALASVARLRRLLLHWHATLSGRIVIGPALLIARCWLGESRRLAHDRSRRRLWLHHAGSVAVLLLWIAGVCRIPMVWYMALAVYPSIALGLVRSFAEHRAAPDPRHRTAVVEAGPFWSLLFLNNNLHVVHHRRPALPWYRIPAAWRALRAETDVDPDMLFRGGYAEIFRRYLLAPAGPVEHPGFSPVTPAVRRGTGCLWSPS